MSSVSLFRYGTQCCRAPSAEPDCWETNLRAIRVRGLHAISLCAQRRWSHRAPGRPYFEELDRSMCLAARNSLRGTLKSILDVSLVGLIEQYPDTIRRDRSGHVAEPRVAGQLEIRGQPGPCGRYAGALAGPLWGSHLRVGWPDARPGRCGFRGHIRERGSGRRCWLHRGTERRV